MESTNDSLMKSGIPGAVVTVSGVLLLMVGAGSTPVVYLGAALVIAGVAALAAGVLGRDGVDPFRKGSGGNADQRRIASGNTSARDSMEHRRLLHGADSFAPTLGELTVQFNDWLDQIDRVEEIWPAFDRWLRDALNEFTEARRVRCYRIVEKRDEPVPLTESMDNILSHGAVPHELLDHVARSGHRYLQGAERHDSAIGETIAAWESRVQNDAPGAAPRLPDAVIPIRRKGCTIGLVVIGDLPETRRHDIVYLRAVEQLINQFWRHVDQYDSLSIAHRIDRASGVLNRLDLTQVADQVLLDSKLDGEPVVVLAVVVEGVRWLDDHGQWTLRDWVMKQIGRTMREKLRSDDLVGRFSDDRFVAILRRLDIALGRIIAGKLMNILDERIRTKEDSGAPLQLRCGLVQSGGNDFAASLSRCFQAVNQARQNREQIRVLEADDRVTQEAGHEV